MVSPQVAKEVRSPIGVVEEVERKQRQDGFNFVMRVKVPFPIAKPDRRGAFISGSDGVHTWVKFKYERLSLFCHYCGMLGHDVKHYASHFAVVKNGGEVDYQYGDFLRAMGGRPRFSPNKNTGPSAEWDHTLGDVQHDGTSPVGNMQGETTKAGNPCAMDVGESENLGFQPKIQQLDNVDSASDKHVDDGNDESKPSGQKFQESNSVQREVSAMKTAGLQTEVAEGCMTSCMEKISV